MRVIEMARAERDRTKALQEQVTGETDRRTRGFGVASLLGPLGAGGGIGRGLRSLLGAG
jgi:hypothetical protein